MVGKRICGDIGFWVWWCYFLGIYEVLDRMAKAHALVGVMDMALMEFAILRWVMVFGQDCG